MDSLIRLAELAPAYVGLIIFVWYTIRRDGDWRTWLTGRDEQWIKFLDRERDQRRDVMNRAYGDFKSAMQDINKSLNELTTAMTTHESTAVSRNEKIAELLETMVDTMLKHDERAGEYIAGQKAKLGLD